MILVLRLCVLDECMTLRFSGQFWECFRTSSSSAFCLVFIVFSETLLNLDLTDEDYKV